MRKILKNNAGITLVSLVVTVIVLLIIASVGAYAGVDAVNNTKYTKFIAELKIMQTYVDQWYEELKPSKESEWEAKLSNKFSSVEATKASGNVQAETALEYAGFSNVEDFYLLDEKQIKDIGIDGVSQSVLVDVKNRKVVSYLGIKNKDRMYYTLDENDVYNVEFDSNRVNQ